MPAAVINTEIRNGDGINTEESIKAVRLALAEVYSNKNLGLNVRNLIASATLDVTDCYVYVSGGGTINLTLPPACVWSTTAVYKTPFIIIQTDNITPVNIIVDVTNGDSIDGSTATLALDPTTMSLNCQIILFNNGINAWYTLVQRNNNPTFTTPALGTYTPGTFTIPTGQYYIMTEHLILSVSQRLTIQGTGSLRIT